MQLFSNQIIQHLNYTSTYTFVLYSYLPLQLLELPQFQDIIKIKTIGSTYMAASGLNPSRQVKVINLYLQALSHTCEVKIKQDRQGTCGVSMWRVRVTTAEMEKQ